MNPLRVSSRKTPINNANRVLCLFDSGPWRHCPTQHLHASIFCTKISLVHTQESFTGLNRRLHKASKTFPHFPRKMSSSSYPVLNWKWSTGPGVSTITESTKFTWKRSMLLLPVNSRPALTVHGFQKALSARSPSILTFRNHKNVLEEGNISGGHDHGGDISCCYHRTCIRRLLLHEKEILSIRLVERLSVVEAL